MVPISISTIPSSWALASTATSTSASVSSSVVTISVSASTISSSPLFYYIKTYTKYLP